MKILFYLIWMLNWKKQLYTCRHEPCCVCCWSNHDKQRVHILFPIVQSFVRLFHINISQRKLKTRKSWTEIAGKCQTQIRTSICIARVTPSIENQQHQWRVTEDGAWHSYIKEILYVVFFEWTFQPISTGTLMEGWIGMHPFQTMNF